ncbi:MAG: hypothetical protein ACPLZH_03490, partial [Minisyncoccales bacterium]
LIFHMALEVQKKENESPMALIRRFNHALQQAGILPKARFSQFKQRPKSETTKKKDALWRIEKAKEKMRLFKLGKIE